MLATWSSGLKALQQGWAHINKGRQPLAAVVAGCQYAEDDRENHTVGYSGYPDESGEVSLDASVMLSPAQSGAVAYVRKYAHAAGLARRVMEKTTHKMLVGEGAEDFAQQCGWPRKKLLTMEMKKAHQQWLAGWPAPHRVNIEERQCMGSHDTIGILAVNRQGRLAGACSTSGLAFKKKGRVGDSPTIGHGLYVEPEIGAAVLTGIGERVMGVCGSFLAIEQLRMGRTPQQAAHAVMNRMLDAYKLGKDDQVGIIILKPDGAWTSLALRKGFSVSVHDANRCEVVASPHILH